MRDHGKAVCEDKFFVILKQNGLLLF